MNMCVGNLGTSVVSLLRGAERTLRCRKGLASLVAACLLIHLCGICDVLLRSLYVMKDYDVFLVWSSIGALAFIIFFPRLCSWTTLIIWCVALFPCDLWSPLPWEYLAACALALGVIGYFRLDQGLTLAAIVSGMSWVFSLIGIGVADTDGGNYSQEFFLMVALFLVFALIGGLVKQNQCQMELCDKVRRQEEQLEIAHALHDYVANDIADAILLLGQVRVDDSTNVDEVAKCLQQASRHSYALIERLEDTSSLEDRVGDVADIAGGRRSALEVTGSDVLEGLREIVQTQQSRLELRGFDGIALLPDLISGNDCTKTEDLLFGLVRELFADISKHADVRYGYVLTIEASLDEYLIRLRNVIATHSSIESGGTGLRRFEAQLERQGGYLHIQDGDVKGGFSWWSLEARIPRGKDVR